MDFRIPNSIKRSFIISGFLLFVIFGLSLWSLNRLVNKADWVEHTNVVLLKLENILSLLKDAETGQRGYLLTEDEDFLEPYIGSYYNTIQRFKEIRELTIDNSIQQQKLDTLISLINKRFSILNQTIELEKNGQNQPAKLIVASKEGKLLMDNIRKLVKRMQSEELRLKAIRYDQVRTSSYITPVTIIALTLVSLIIIVFAYRKTKKEMLQSAQLNEQLSNTNTELIKAKESLNLLNMELEQKVAERTYHLNNTKEKLTQVNDELTRKNKDLLRTNADLDDFIYTASHDLKAPITNIEGITLALQDTECYQAEEPRQLIGMLANACTTLNEVIEVMAQVKNLEYTSNIKTEELDIKLMTEEIKGSLSGLFEETQAQLTLDSEEARHVPFSRNNFYSVLYHLIQNAIRYRSPERNPHIHISTRKLPGNILVSVQDNGLGIDPNKTTEMFELFKKLHNQPEGTGAGLFIVKRIMDNANGKIEVESKLDQGTTFHLFFPNANN